LYLVEVYRGYPNNSSEDYQIELTTNITKELNNTECCSQSEFGREGRFLVR
jgi:hypothetical protein